MVTIDPVCKMKVGENETNYISTYRGFDYYFCAAPCKREFDEHPKDYVSNSRDSQVNEHTHEADIQENEEARH